MKLRGNQRFLALVLAGLPGVSTGAFAHGFDALPTPRVTCATLLRALRERLGGGTRDVTETYDELLARKTTRQSVFFESGLRDELDRLFWIFQRRHGEWGSQASTTGYDPQGDPRWFLEVMGSDVAHVWGYHWDGADRMQLPSPATWRAILTAVSAQLQSRGLEPIPTGFHANLHTNPRTKKINFKKYFDLFIRYGLIPLAGRGLPFLHDMNFHSGVVLLEKRWIDAARHRTEYYYGAHQHLRELAKNTEDPERQHLLEKISLSLREFTVGVVDSGTGMINVATIAAQRNPEAAVHDETLKSAFYFLVGLPGQSVTGELTSFLINLQKKERGQRPHLFSTAELMEIAREFSRDFRSEIGDFDVNAKVTASVEDFCHSLSARRQQLREVSEDLARTAPAAPLALEPVHVEPMEDDLGKNDADLEPAFSGARRWISRLFFWR
ncbi:MAG TPA: hypothetical protein VM901_06840 [Bdellovibrionota bacterium]|nr:hypothetical protein [Bdellovibrionota bacterium]